MKTSIKLQIDDHSKQKAWISFLDSKDSDSNYNINIYINLGATASINIPISEAEFKKLREQISQIYTRSEEEELELMNSQHSGENPVVEKWIG